MQYLQSWKPSDLRGLAGDFRKRAAETGQSQYAELMLFTAEQLDREADRAERNASPGNRISILV
jgi:hypothetical protein